MISPVSFAAAFLVAALGSDGHGVRPAPIAGSTDIARVASDIALASGKLARPRFRHGLFRVGPLWFQVPPDAPFHDWLLRAQGGQAALQTSDALVASRLETYMGNSVAESRVSIVIRVE